MPLNFDRVLTDSFEQPFIQPDIYGTGTGTGGWAGLGIGLGSGLSLAEAGLGC